MKNKIIQFLKESDDYLSGEEISRKLNVSRAGIWKNIEELRKTGYGIDAISHKGYILTSTPDKLLPQEIKTGLNTKILGKEVVYYESVDSTMKAAFKYGLDGCAEGLVVCAEEQTAGKGRLGRKWQSPKSKGIYMSLVLRPQLVATDVAKLTLLTGVAVYEAIKKVADIDIKIKWPNDLLVGKHKVCGILTELHAEMERVKFVVIGIGINVNNDIEELLPEATSIKQESKNTVSRIKIVQEILRSMELWYGVVQDQGFAPVLQKWNEYASTINKRIQIQDVEGEAIGLDEYGGLMIRTDEGIVVRRMSGDVMELS
ncbi:MAG: BirA family biotin operon repressor/biotin-[acetyl-CoA-carboxylase] ligase [Lysobacterales bacterium]|jgi:BirA family biotin operon repressor/biotin-[acetyl-CoA-carboxylase] ligase